MSQLDWSLGEYEWTATDLRPAAVEAVKAAALSAGQRVIDVGCGSGNAALLAAELGADTTGVDPAARLREVGAKAAAAAGQRVTFLDGTAEALPVPDRCADAVLSVFGVIFASDAARAAAEMARVLRPSGRIVITAWNPAGLFPAITAIPIAALREIGAGAPAAAPFAWHDHTAVGELLAPHGFTLSTEARDLVVTADSVDDFWTTRFVRHPLGAAFLPVLEQAGLLDSVRAAAVDLLAGANQDPHGFRVSASYVVHRAVR